jgi:hypothetical protein
MAVDLDRPYSAVAFKASHNSYERDELPVSTQFADLGDSSWQGRCRGIELDLNASGRNWLWSVNHVGGYEGSADQQLSCYLTDLARWHRDHPDHHVITVTLDLKDGGPLDEKLNRPSELARQLDATLVDHLGDAIFRPRDLRGNHATLLEGARSWPSLKALTGKFIFFLSGSGKLKEKYVEGGPDVCCFIDRKFSPGNRFTPEETPDIVFYNVDMDAWMQPNAARLRKAIRDIAEDGRCIVRGYGINNAQAWTAARDAGLTMLSTDKVRGHEWATVGDEPFMPRLDVGVPRGRARKAAPRSRSRAPKRAPAAQSRKLAGASTRRRRTRRK